MSTNMYGVIFMERMSRKDFEKDYVKAVKKALREEYGLTPTHIEKSKKTYDRNKIKDNDRHIDLDAE